MAFSTYTPLAVYPANGVQIDFDVPDYFYDIADVRCVVVIDGEEIPQVAGVDFAVIVLERETTPPYRQGGIVRFAIPPVNGADVVPFILPSATQDQPFEGRVVTPRQHERVHDREVQTTAMLLEFFNRSYRSPLNTPAALRTIVAGREGYVPTWDIDGNLIEGPTVQDVNVVAGFIGEVVIVAGIHADVTTVAANNARVTTVANNIGAVVAVADSIAAVNVVATNITSVNTTAANIAAIIAAPAAATAAANSAAAALASKNATEALYDSFDDRYLGAKAANPTLDNDGNALIDGAIYFNTAAKELRFYDLASTTWIAATNVLSAVPVGMIGAFPKNTAPAGWLIANGSTFSSGTYPDLATYLGSTTLPDLRGEFIRGLDNGRGVDTGRANMSSQLDGVGPHNHGINSQIFTADVGTAFAYTSGTNNRAFSPSSTQGVVGGISETRPRNIAMVLCIKAFGGIINQGALDAAAVAADQLNFIRFNAAQTLTQAQKGQVAANIGHAWEQIGATINLAGLSQVDWTNLSAYSDLRIEIEGVSAVTTSFPGLRVSSNNGGAYDAGAADYGYQMNNSIGSAAPISSQGSANNMALIPSALGITYGFSAKVYLSAWNKARLTYAKMEATGINSSSIAFQMVAGQYRSGNTAYDALRFFNSAGAMTSGTAKLFGIRG